MSAPGPHGFRQDVSLCAIARDQFELVRHVSVAPEQVVYCGTVSMAFRSREPGIDFHAVRCDKRICGFFKIDHKVPQTQDYARPFDLGLRAFMIDQNHQSWGIGSAAIAALPRYLHCHYPAARGLVLTVDMRNMQALRCYLRAGCQQTGALHQGTLLGAQHVLRLPLPQAPSHL